MNRDDRIIILLGELRADTRGLAKSVDRLAHKVDDQGAQLAKLPCSVHGKRISDLFARTEGSAQYILVESERRKMVGACLAVVWKIARVAIPALVAGGGIAAALAALTGGCW